MIVTVTRHAADLAAIHRSGMRAIAAPTVDAGLQAAARSDADLLVVDLPSDAYLARSSPSWFRAEVPCPVIVRHDVTAGSVAALYELASADADIRSSFRPYDELSDRIRTAPRQNDTNATPVILRRLSRVAHPGVRDFIGIMAILGERPVLQARVAAAMGLSTSSLRRWLGDRRTETPRLPRFPAINAVFVALHFVWRNERLGWTSKRAASAGGFSDDKSSANYLRYHLGKTGGQLSREAGFDALMTETQHMFSDAAVSPGADALRRI